MARFNICQDLEMIQTHFEAIQKLAAVSWRFQKVVQRYPSGFYVTPSKELTYHTSSLKQPLKGDMLVFVEGIYIKMPFWTLENPEKRPLTYFTLKLGSLIFVLEKWIFPGLFHHGKIPKKGDKQGYFMKFYEQSPPNLHQGCSSWRVFPMMVGTSFHSKSGLKKNVYPPARRKMCPTGGKWSQTSCLWQWFPDCYHEWGVGLH